MKIGVVKEIKNHEYRVALTPAGADELVRGGHEVLVQASAGEGSGLADASYEAAGARIVSDAGGVFGEAEMILKVKEPLEAEWALMRKGQVMFTYLHLAADRKLTDAVVATSSHAFAYETLEVDRKLPLLEPMSEVAGRLSIQAGAKYLERPAGGTGILLGGVPGVAPAHVLVLGGGVVGTNAARMAAGLGANVSILDISLDRMQYLDEILPPNCTTLYNTRMTLHEELAKADLVVGAVLIPGAAAPKLVSREDLATMKPGSVICDVAVDQGGCVETCKPTTHEEPTFVVDGVVHYCVANMPGAVPRTSTFALTNATLPWVRRLADLGPARAIHQSPPLAKAANAIAGRLTCQAVAEAFDMNFHPPEEAAAAID
ncbi:MAG: alanine dehydrogenase [bacterium]|nr:alanine dehydrogenase [bacterium]